MKARKPCSSSWSSPDLPHVLDPLLERLDVAVHHRRRRRHAEPMGLTHDVEPLLGLRLLRRDDRPDAVDEDLGAAAGNGVEAGVAEPRQRLGHRQLRAPCDVLDLGGREGVQVDLVTGLDRAEEILVVVDPEVGVMTALHQEPRAADREGLLDLLVDDGLREEVALAHVARSAVERAEVAVGDADVRVVEVPIDDERHPRRIVQTVPHLVGDAADLDEVARTQERDGVVVRDPLASERLVEDVVDRGSRLGGDRHAGTSSRTNRSSGTWSSAPTSRAISRKV